MCLFLFLSFLCCGGHAVQAETYDQKYYISYTTYE